MNNTSKRLLGALLMACVITGIIVVHPLTASAVDSTTPLFAGDLHSLALSDGTVWAWGLNTWGQLGDGSPNFLDPLYDGTTAFRFSPVKVSDLGDVRAISAGSWHSLALKGDGTVWSWGNNGNSQLSDDAVWNWSLGIAGFVSDGNTSGRSVPGQVSHLSDVVAVAAGHWHSLALKGDGTVWSWGDNYYSQLGTNCTTQGCSVPGQVSGLNDVVSIAAGWYHSLALKSDGTVWAWGSNSVGQLGDRTTTDTSIPIDRSSVPGQVFGLSDVVAIAAGDLHSLALKGDGTVWAWGNNKYGQLGDGSTDPRSVPGQVFGLSDVVSIIAGAFHSLALRGDGSVWVWGNNELGQLGDGSAIDRSVPVKVPDLTDVIALAAGWGHSLVLKSDGTVWAWGRNDSGQLGDGTNTNHNTPIRVLDLLLLTSTLAPTPTPMPTPIPTLSGSTSTSTSTPMPTSLGSTPTPAPILTSSAPTLTPVPTPISTVGMSLGSPPASVPSVISSGESWRDTLLWVVLVLVVVFGVGFGVVFLRTKRNSVVFARV